jgi:hypothetical protein
MAISKKWKKLLIIGSIILGVILLTIIAYYILNAVNQNNLKYSSNGYGYSSEEIGMEEDRTFTSPESLELDASNYDEANTTSKIRKSGSIDISVEDLDIAHSTILNILENYNGSVVSSSESGQGNEKIVYTTLKIPVEKFDDIYNDIKNIDGEVTYASYYTDDITQEYTDLESRLRNLQETEEQLVEILETAETVEDTLAVYEQLTSIRSQIEVLEGQIKYLDNQVDYSYITVTLTLSDVGKEITDEQWNPLGILKTAFGSLVNFGKFLVNVLIWLVVFSPAIAIGVVIVILIKKNAKKKK